MQNNMVRIDRFLQHTRLLPSRKEAKAMLDDRSVRLNDKFAKPSSMVKNDDIITLYFPDEIVKVKVSLKELEFIKYVGYSLISKDRKEIFEC